MFYVSAGLDVWSVNKASGEATILQRFEHYVSKPVLYDDISESIYILVYQLFHKAKKILGLRVTSPLLLRGVQFPHVLLVLLLYFLK